MPTSFSIRTFSQQVLLGSLFCMSVAHAAGYTVLDLGSAGPSDINNNGQVIGGGATSWDSDGTAQPLTGLTYAFRINNQGTVLGVVIRPTSDPRYSSQEAVIRTADGSITSVATISPIADAGQDLVAITQDNKVLFRSTTGSFLWNSQNQVSTLAHTNGVNYNLVATGINTNGTVIGNATQTANTALGYKIVYLVGSTNATAADPGLVTPSKYLSFNPVALNEANQVIGKKETVNSKLAVTATKGYIWSSSGGEKTLPSLFLYAFTIPSDINAQGQVVGTAKFSSSSTTTVGFFWSPKTGTVNLNNQIGNASSTVKVLGAQAINDAGQIAAIGMINGQYRTLLLTPKP